MKTSLPVAKISKGFTLIELMVVITIIAILAVIGLTIFTGAQRSARDARRQGDIDSIANAIEVHYNQTNNQYCTASGGTYCPLSSNWFSASILPTDPQGGGIDSYCIQSSTTPGTTIANSSSWTTTGCPVGWTAVSNSTPTAGSFAWKVCATLEKDGNTTHYVVYCKGNSQ